ncbi:hypothetical protein RB195_023125 [Necator americanus]|uniref:Uncharacterized protein n=1 Tax=Necator americanus TaxID=51031 RepID=A0ABR1EHW4_NECAM
MEIDRWIPGCHPSRCEGSIEPALFHNRSLKATDNCWMATPKSRRKSACVDLRILFDNVENGGVFDSVEASRPGLIFEVGVSACEASEPALDSPDGSSGLAQSADCCRCSNAATPFIEDDSPKLLLHN